MAIYQELQKCQIMRGSVLSVHGLQNGQRGALVALSRHERNCNQVAVDVGGLGQTIDRGVGDTHALRTLRRNLASLRIRLILCCYDLFGFSYAWKQPTCAVLSRDFAALF